MRQMNHDARRRALIAAGLGAAILPRFAQAQSDAEAGWPGKGPIRVIVPVAPGGVHDLVIRALQPKLQQELGQSIVVQNRPGGDWVVGTLAGKQAAPDGYTWVMASIPTTANAVLKKVPYDPVADFAAVANIGSTAGVMVVPRDLGPKSLADFIQLARSKPGELAFANAAAGSLGHLNAALLEATAGLQFNTITYPGGQSSLLTDLLSGRVQFAVISPIVALSHMQAGKLTPLAIAAPKRSPLLPDVPTTVELGHPRLTVQAWSGMLMPAGTPPGIVRKANAALHAAAADPEVARNLQQQAITLHPPSTPEAFAAFIRAEMAEWPKLFELARIKRETA